MNLFDFIEVNFLGFIDDWMDYVCKVNGGCFCLFE